MQLGLVVGHATGTVKHPSLSGQKLLVVQMLTPDDRPDGEPVLVIDHIGACEGCRVVATTDAVLVREMVGARNSPIRWSVMGIADE